MKDMGYSNRNLVLDILRGHFLLAILVDHLNYYTGNSLFTYYNGNGSLWVSAAEGFVFLSGFFTYYIYYSKLLISGFKSVLVLLWKKSLNLYFWSVLLTVIYTLIGFYIGKAPLIGNGLVFVGIPELLIDTLTFRYNYGWADILILYIPLLFIAPFILWMFKKNLSWLVLFMSLVIWSFNIPSVVCNRMCVSFFDLTSWQLMYVLGMYVGLHKDVFRKIFVYIKRNNFLSYSIFFVFILSLIFSVLVSFYNIFSFELISFFELLFNKETLGIGRIVLFGIWFFVAYIFIEKYYKYISKYFGWVYISFGQNSLNTYIIQSVVLLEVLVNPP